MAALSAAVQTFVDHVIKQRIPWLNGTTADAAQEPRITVLVHLITFAVGTVVAASIGLEPLAYLGLSQPLIINGLVAGLLVSYGGSFFNEALGAVREFKKAQQSAQKGADSRGSTTP